MLRAYRDYTYIHILLGSKINSMQTLKFDNSTRKRIINCPCGRSNKDGKFCPFQGFENKGHCHSCGETFLPELKKDDNPDAWRKSDVYKTPLSNIIETVIVEPSFIETVIVEKTLKCYDQNNFYQYLEKVFENNEAILSRLEKLFLIGTAKANRVIFWQRDINGSVRSGKIMAYNPITGKRFKDIKPNWVHSILGLKDHNLQQCLFGEYQLSTDKFKTVCIVESEKTAIVMSALISDCIWLACGGADGLTVKKCKVLQGFKIVLYPDLGKFEQWKQQAKELKATLNLDIAVSELLEDYVSKLPSDEAAAHVKQGFDLEDYAIKYNWFNELKVKAQKPKVLPLSQAETILKNMVQKQPNLINFINRLGMVNPKTMQQFCTV